MVRIKDFCDLHKLEGYVSNWAGATGFAAAVISAEGDMLVVCGMDRETARQEIRSRVSRKETERF